jgi:hypothetical protein
MLLKAKELKGFSLKSIDGDIGSASEFFFDDQYWTIRYLVANTASWLSGKKVLISPYSLTGVNKDYQELAVELTRSRSRTVRPATQISQFRVSTRVSITATTAIPITGEGHMLGEVIHTLSGIAPTGDCPPRKKWDGIAIFAVQMK